MFNLRFSDTLIPKFCFQSSKIEIVLIVIWELLFYYYVLFVIMFICAPIMYTFCYQYFLVNRKTSIIFINFSNYWYIFNNILSISFFDNRKPIFIIITYFKYRCLIVNRKLSFGDIRLIIAIMLWYSKFR